MIGVDIYRDIPEPPGTERLAAVLKRAPGDRLGVQAQRATARIRGSRRRRCCAAPTGPRSPIRRPIPGNIARRGLLYADDGTDNYPGLGMALALGYLAADQILPAAGARRQRCGSARR